MEIMMLAVLIACLIMSILGGLVLTKCLLNGKSIYNSSTVKDVKALMDKEREIYIQMNTKIKEAGVIDKWILKKKLGPLYKWYEGGFLHGEN